jgi:hypothetical protein
VVGVVLPERRVRYECGTLLIARRARIALDGELERTAFHASDCTTQR